MSPHPRRVQRDKRVLKRGVRAPQAAVEARDLLDAQFDQDRLRRQTYMTVPEAMAYMRGFRTAHAFRVWATRNGIRKRRAAGLRFLRADLDKHLAEETVQG